MLAPRFRALLPLASLLTGCISAIHPPMDHAERHEWVGALAFWYAEDSADQGAGDRHLDDLRRRRCAIRKLDEEQAEFFQKSTAYAESVLASPELGALMRDRTSWELTPHTGAQIMEKLRGRGAEINVFLVDWDDEHPCWARELVDGRTNAFTPMSREATPHLLFLYEPYLDGSMERNDVRGLARTLVHEALHALGYSHEGLEVGSARYNASVPAYVGCVIEHWGGPREQAWIKDNCYKADRAQSPLP